jgi:large subunit ribosomal protein L3
LGRRKKHAPKHGSLAFLPRKRAPSPVGSMNDWPKVDFEKPTLLGFIGYKVGMTYVYVISDTRGPTYGQEIFTPVTIVETQPIVMFGFRLYSRSHKGLKTVSEVLMNNPPNDLSRAFKLPRNFDLNNGIRRLEKSMDESSELRAFFATQPRLASVSSKKPTIMEIQIDGGAIEERFDYLKETLGKEVSVSQVLKEGQSVDVIAVTKGKGFQGPVKRWGVKILPRKSRKTRRGVGTLGAWNPSSVMYSVPRAGQMGFHQRTELNKEILKVGSDVDQINPKSGFIHYGLVKSDYLMFRGSIPGSVKRIVKIRYASRPSHVINKASPQITYISC